MSASMHHPDHFRQALRASVKVRPEEKALTDAISDCRARGPSAVAASPSG